MKMNESLINYQIKLQELSEKEEILREKYLKSIADGETLGPLVGYPSIDKPWLKYHKSVEEYRKVPKENITVSLERQNSDNLDGIALDYFYSKITFREFITQKNNLVKALKHFGIEKGDTVAVCCAGIPEAMYSIYAIGHLGATGIFLPPYLDKDTMKSDLKKKNTKLLFVMDVFYDKFKDVFSEVVQDTGIGKIVIIPTLNSSKLRILKKDKRKLAENEEYYNKFVEDGKLEKLPNPVDYEKDMPVAVVYSSGTTGKLKGILLSHDTFNNSAASYLSFGFDLSKGQRVYQAIPIWASTGLIADGTTPLYYGCTLHQNPKFDPIVYSKNLGLFKDNWGIATTELFNGIGELNKQKLFRFLLKLGVYDYSQLNNVYIGGTLATENDIEKLNELLKSIGCNAKVRRSYGTCENGSIVSAELNGYEHPANSVGVPIPGNIVVVVDENGNELPYYQRGEIAVKTDCGMLDYYNRNDLSKEIFFTNSSMLKLKHTGDIGYITPDGNLIYEGRKNDISIINGKQIYNFDIKRIILGDPDVDDCEVFANEENQLCVNIIFKKKFDGKIDEKIRELQEKLFMEYNCLDYVPEQFKVRESFPMSSSTKRNYALIKSEKEGYDFYDKNNLNKELRLKI
jgi:long-chain acyl-CoA synthetase